MARRPSTTLIVVCDPSRQILHPRSIISTHAVEYIKYITQDWSRPRSELTFPLKVSCYLIGKPHGVFWASYGGGDISNDKEVSGPIARVNTPDLPREFTAIGAFCRMGWGKQLATLTEEDVTVLQKLVQFVAKPPPIYRPQRSEAELEAAMRLFDSVDENSSRH